jgi:hypothetical protein
MGVDVLLHKGGGKDTSYHFAPLSRGYAVREVEIIDDQRIKMNKR